MTFVFRQSARRFALASLVATTALAAALPAAAFEPTGNEIADVFLAGIEASGATDLKVGAVSGDDDTTEIVALAATIKEGDTTSQLDIDRIVIDEADIVDGRIEAGSVTANGIVMSSPSGKFTAGKASATGVRIPSAADIGSGPEAMAQQSVYDGARLEGIVFSDNEGLTVPVESIALDADDIVDGIARKGSLRANRIVIDVNALPDDAEGKPELLRLGYDRLTLSLAMAGEWDADTATGTLETFEITAENAGTLTVSAKVGGLTEEVVEKLKTTDNPDETTQLLQGLTVQDVSIDFTDDSLTGRLLDAQAKESGTTGAVLADQIAASLPAMLSMLQNPTFEKSVAAAAGSFLKSPGSIKATAKPASPVPIAMIVGTAMMAPQTLPNVLNVEVVSTGK